MLLCCGIQSILAKQTMNFGFDCGHLESGPKHWILIKFVKTNWPEDLRIYMVDTIFLCDAVGYEHTSTESSKLSFISWTHLFWHCKFYLDGEHAS